jgi:hypothetical protein
MIRETVLAIDHSYRGCENRMTVSMVIQLAFSPAMLWP